MQQTQKTLSAFTTTRLWVFDLDNTLYPYQTDLWNNVDKRMTAFISEQLNLTPQEAYKLQKDYLVEYGLTAIGLYKNHGIDPEVFMMHAHDMDISPMPKNPRLGEILATLPGRVVVHTNNARQHTERVLKHLGIEQAIDAIYDISSIGYIAKPNRAAYEFVLKAEKIDAIQAAMFEDAARNLVEPFAMGMRTIWIPTQCSWAVAGAQEGHIEFVAEDLTLFVEQLAKQLVLSV